MKKDRFNNKVIIAMKINDLGAKYCLFCKQLLTDKSEIKLQHHIACAQDITSFNKNSSQAFQKIQQSFGITSLEIENSGFPEQGMCKFKIDNQGDIISVFFRNYALNTLPETISSLSKLEKLSIRYSPIDYYDRATVPQQLRELPEEICNLHNLQHLDFTECRMKTLPDNFGDLTNLKIANFEGNAINEIPHSFGNLQKLMFLNLSNNKISKVPEEIFDLKNLKHLNLKENRIKEIPDSIGNLKNLSTLDLRTNELKTLSRSFFELPDLKNIFLDKNQLQHLPDEIGKLTNLQVLNVDGNEKLQSLPMTIAELSELRKLFLAGTNIRNFPDAIGSLKKLHTIGLSYKQTVNFSKFAKDLPNLKKVIIYPVAYRDFGWDRWEHKYHYSPLRNLSKLPMKSVRESFKELMQNGCAIYQLSDTNVNNSW